MNYEPLRLRVGDVAALARYVAVQLQHLCPDAGLENDLTSLLSLVPTALDRMRPILASVRAFDPTHFNHWNALQYASFLYLVANTQWRMDPTTALVDRLFCLNRALHSLDVYPAVHLPEVFFVSHGSGAVLGSASYGERLVFFQNVTVGRVGGDRPSIGDDVVIYPGAIITGKSAIGDRSVVAAGTILHNVDVPSDSVVSGRYGDIVLRPRQRDYLGLYLRPSTGSR